MGVDVNEAWLFLPLVLDAADGVVVVVDAPVVVVVVVLLVCCGSWCCDI